MVPENLTEEKHRQLERLNDVFLEENTKLNLSAFRTKELSWTGNILDSLAFLQSPCPRLLAHGAQVLDIGTGGGFPLLPLAICLPEQKFFGMDSTQKKLEAIQSMVTRLKIPNITLMCGRAEELGRDLHHREQYDMVTARALAPLNVLLEYCSPFVRVGGYIVAWKSMNVEQEVHESLLSRAELSCHLNDQYEYDLGEHFGRRQLLLFEKGAKTDDTYPRDIGIPKKKPLL